MSVLLCGAAMALSTGSFTSCSDDNDDLANRVTVLEGVYGDLKAQLGNALTTGASITAYDLANGVWTLKLSDGKDIVIDTNSTGGASGGGSSVTVEMGDGFFTIIVNGTPYTIPTGASVNSLIYMPEYADGMVEIGNDAATVKFLVRPAIETLDGATFSIGESHELKTRAADGEQFKVVDGATIESGVISIPIRGLGVTAGNMYAIAVQMNLKGTVISSNYFNVKMSSDYLFNSEELVEPTFDGAITDASVLDGGFKTATLPDSKADFLGEFNFNDLMSLPGIDKTKIVFELGSKDLQNKNVKDRYDFFKSCLSANGAWKMQGRPGTNCSKPAADANPDGLLIVLKENEVVKAKVYWKINDPIAALDFTGELADSPHLEWGGRDEDLKPEARTIDIPALMAKGAESFPIGGDNAYITKWADYSVDGGKVISMDGGKLTLGTVGEKYAKNSRGIYWTNVQTSLTDTKDGQGEVLEGYDGISQDVMKKMGITITDKGEMKLDASYIGVGIRLGLGIRYEYAYGEKNIGAGVFAFIWFNRRIGTFKDVAPAEMIKKVNDIVNK